MAICTFFGHRDCPSSVYPSIKTCIENLIQTEKADSFYVGENGRFDALVLKALQELKRQYPKIQFSMVLSSMPSDKPSKHHIETILPDCVENTPRRFAVDRRNRWMLMQAEIVITYIDHPWGGAAKFAALAEHQGKTVIPLGTV